MKQYKYGIEIKDKYFGNQVLEEHFDKMEDAIQYAKKTFKRQEFCVHRIEAEDVGKDYADVKDVYVRIRIGHKLIEKYV